MTWLGSYIHRIFLTNMQRMFPKRQAGRQEAREKSRERGQQRSDESMCAKGPG